MDLTVTGVEDFQRAAKALRLYGDKELRREFYMGLNRAVKPLTKDVKAAPVNYLPARYARLIERELKVKTRRRAAGANPAIYLVGEAKTRDVRSLNRGRLRHPLFGNRGHWYDTRVRPGFWTDTLTEGAPEVRRELVKVMNDTVDKIARAAR